MGTTLVFPCCVPAALEYAEEARRRGEVVIAASSLAFDETARHFPTWFRLPNVYAPDFAARLSEAVAIHRIERVFAPVSAAHWMLGRLVARGEIDLELIGEMPIRRHAREHARLMADADARLADIASMSDDRSTLTRFEVAAVLRHSTAVFGESSEAKIAALMAIFAAAPKGDVVEIGVLTGSSASVLEMMASRYDSGPVLAVDPWSYANSVQQESPRDLQEMVDVWDASVPFETFLTQLLPIARHGEFNYLPLTSREAHGYWLRDRKIRSAEFGETRYGGEIAVLHIDGNHDYTAVNEDVALWASHLRPGGWLVLDDYFWLHGDGPRRVGDEFLAARADDVARAFVCGSALFVQLSVGDVG
jgi:hypothetical protein